MTHLIGLIPPISVPCTSGQRIGLNGGGDMSTLSYDFRAESTRPVTRPRAVDKIGKDSVVPGWQADIAC